MKDDVFFNIGRQYKDLQAQNKQKAKAVSKDRLAHTIKKKTTTIFIGALDSIEKKFGHWWGYGKEDELTSREEEIQQMWLELREEILNKSNNQLRALMQELSEYDVEWLRKQYIFPISQVYNKGELRNE